LSGSFRIDNVVPQPNGESSEVKLKVRVNINGLFTVSSATMKQKIESSPEDAEPMDVDNGVKEKKTFENGKEEEKAGEEKMAQDSQSNTEQVAPDNEANTSEQSTQVNAKPFSFVVEVSQMSSEWHNYWSTSQLLYET